MKLKKLIIPIVIFILVAICGGVYLNYRNTDKIEKGVACKSLDKHGKPVDIASTFSTKDKTVYLSAKSNTAFVRKAKMEWYKGQVDDKNMLKVEKDIPLSSGGYFNSKLSVSEGLTEGNYRVIIRAGDRLNIESIVDFEVK